MFCWEISLEQFLYFQPNIRLVNVDFTPRYFPAEDSKITPNDENFPTKQLQVLHQMKQGAEKAHAGFSFDPGGTLSNFADEKL